MNEKCITVVIISILLSLGIVSSLPLPLAIGQPETRRPVILIHGYASDAGVWKNWENWLRNDGIIAHAIAFHDNPTTTINEDECGSAKDHASQLNQIIENFTKRTGEDKINIVTHSKGGLDARLYMANDSNNDVANLIMIGTPNEGSPIADQNADSDPCKPAVDDLLTTSYFDEVEKNEYANYYTIAGDWTSDYRLLPGGWGYQDINCPYPTNWFDLEGWSIFALQFVWRVQIMEDNDGIVPVDSVEEPGEFMSLGQTNHCHTNLFTAEEYNMTRRVLLRSE